jgi:calcium-dependent protein kinase
LTAVVNREKLLGNAKLEETFKLFDLDGDGLIKKANFEEVLGGIDIDEAHWKEILAACDDNKDGMVVVFTKLFAR